MIYKNKYNLPEYVYKALIVDEYDYEDNVFSATTLLIPVRQFALYKKYKDKLEIDVSELIASRFGSAIHSAFEKVQIYNIERETRMYTPLIVDNKEYNISGKFDMLIKLGNGDQKLIDIKSTSVWTYIYNSKEKDYRKQLSIYRYLCHKNGYRVISNAEICMVFTDWSKKLADRDISYPQIRIAIKQIELMGDKEIEDFMIDKIRRFVKAISGTESELPLCNDEELWKDNNGVVHRCDYCMAKQFCSQYSEMEKRC